MVFSTHPCHTFYGVIFLKAYHHNINWASFVPDAQGREELLSALCGLHSSVNRRVLGKSLCGRPIDLLQLGAGNDPVLLCGAFHGMEWLTSLLLLRFTAQMAAALETGALISDISLGGFLRRRGVVVIPCVNPDGVEISLHGSAAAGEYRELVYNASQGDTSQWQANARGVDLNHNFNAGWESLHALEREQGIHCPAPTRYGGEYPESEPETKLLCDFCRGQYFRHALAFHSQGEEIYWDFGEDTPQKSRLMAQVMAASSGYRVSEPEAIATGGGFKDWFLSYFHRPAFTIEIGKGKNPLPLSDLPEIHRTLEEMLVFSVIM